MCRGAIFVGTPTRAHAITKLTVFIRIKTKHSHTLVFDYEPFCSFSLLTLLYYLYMNLPSAPTRFLNNQRNSFNHVILRKGKFFLHFANEIIPLNHLNSTFHQKNHENIRFVTLSIVNSTINFRPLYWIEICLESCWQLQITNYYHVKFPHDVSLNARCPITKSGHIISANFPHRLG